ncbi:MAG: MoxR family ATPase [Clostridiales bacterium]|nr:MoxR family ATPase [Clostridiales bacterium]
MPQSDTLQKIIFNMETVIVGKRNIIELALIALLSDGHLLLEDVPGVGKTTLAKSLAQSVKCSFARIQFTPDTLPSDVTGMTVYNMQTGEFRYSAGAVMNDILLADEINRTSPKTQASLLEAMEEHQITVDGTTYPLPELFMVIATQNPIEQLGTYRLPEAQMDRFMMKVSMGYPEKIKEETDIVRRIMDGEPLKKLLPVTSKEDIIYIKEEIKKVIIHEDIISYAVEIARHTRRNRYLTLGASPRAAIALTRAARSRAYLLGRSYVTPEDITVLAEPVLMHRLVLSSEARLEGKKEKDILQEALHQTKVPIL